MSENKDLIEVFKNSRNDAQNNFIAAFNPPINYDQDGIFSDQNVKKEEQILRGLVQWTTPDGKTFIPASTTADKITPGVYEIRHSDAAGTYFQKIPVLTQGLLRFPQTNSEKVVTEIQKFWERESLFREYKLTYKRGIILWGPPGSGKSCTIQLIMRDVVDRGGIVIKFTHPSLFTEGMRIFREVEPDTPIVVLMEDIDSTLHHFNESEVLNILDGVNQIEKAVFLATTNYPEELGERIINRPSRFDKRFKIDHPDSQSRKMYFEYLIGEKKIDELNIPIDKWVADTEKFSLAHLKELFVAVVILGDQYEEAIETLLSMKEERLDSSKDEYRSQVGFVKHKKRGYRD
jgi:GTPase SAR1 family protein